MTVAILILLRADSGKDPFIAFITLRLRNMGGQRIRQPIRCKSRRRKNKSNQIFSKTMLVKMSHLYSRRTLIRTGISTENVM